MFIDVVPNRHYPPTVLLRESYRENGKARKRTLGNFSKVPPQYIPQLKALFKGGYVIDSMPKPEVRRSLPHGHVAAILGTIRQLGLPRLIDRQPSPARNLVIALLIARLLEPRSKLATACGLNAATARHSLAQTLNLTEVTENQLYAAMDWLGKRQAGIERRLAKRHLSEGSLVLYDVTSIHMEGHCCPLSEYGYSRDGRRGKKQIQLGLLCDGDGCPVAVEVFAGNVADPSTVGSQIERLRNSFGLKRVVLVGDRGMLTEARLREDVAPAGFDWISALRGPAIRTLVEQGTIQPSLFDETDLLEVESTAYPGERLVVCRNPLQAARRERKREALLQATERELERVVAAVQRPKWRLRGAARIALRVGKVIGRHRMEKHFELDIGDDHFAWRRDAAGIAAEAALDGLYVVRARVPAEQLDAQGLVRSYKSLSRVERAFRCLKTVDLKVRPVYHYTEARVRAHVFLCMLAYHVEWHMRRRLAPLLFEDEGEPQQDSVAAAKVSASAARKASRKKNSQDYDVQSWSGLLGTLGTLQRQLMHFDLPGMTDEIWMTTSPTRWQKEAFRLLGVRVECVQ